MPMAIHTKIRTPMAALHTHSPHGTMETAAAAPLAIMTAVQPTSCNTLRLEKRMEPFSPKDSFTVSMALFSVLAPIMPAR